MIYSHMTTVLISMPFKAESCQKALLLVEDRVGMLLLTAKYLLLNFKGVFSANVRIYPLP